MKFTLTVFFLCLISQSSFSQSFDAGFRIGFTATQVNGDRLAGFDKAGIVGGIYVSRKLSESFSAQMEMIYIQKGSRKPTNKTDNTFYLLRVNYIEVPVLLKWHVSKKLALTGGPSFGTLVGTFEEDEWQEYDSRDQFKKFELSINGGIQYSFSDNWLLDLRYNESLTPIRPFPGVTTSYFDRGQYNIVIETSVVRRF